MSVDNHDPIPGSPPASDGELTHDWRDAATGPIPIVGTAEAHTPTTGGEPPSNTSGKSISPVRVLSIVAGLLLLAVVGTTAMWFTTASSLNSERERTATLEKAAAAQISADSAVPNLQTVADEYFGDAYYVIADEGSARITITDGNISESALPLTMMLSDLGFSSAVIDRMSNTRALDGTLDAEGKNCNVTWTYHPDDGLQMVFEAEAGQLTVCVSAASWPHLAEDLAAVSSRIFRIEMMSWRLLWTTTSALVDIESKIYHAARIRHSARCPGGHLREPVRRHQPRSASRGLRPHGGRRPEPM